MCKHLQRDRVTKRGGVEDGAMSRKPPSSPYFFFFVLFSFPLRFDLLVISDVELFIYFSSWRMALFLRARTKMDF